MDRIEYAEKELECLKYYCEKLVRTYELIRNIDMVLTSYGVHSPSIMHPEEAKYQKGTKVYSVVPLLELFAEQDHLKAEYEDFAKRCRRIQLFLIQLTEEELRLITERYEDGYTYSQMGVIHNTSKDSVRRTIDKILLKF